jgi:predicted Zn finger-like uncharacterized protein
MNLITRCPSCGTAFRAQPEQLSAHGGHVRCGHCGQIFDGLAHLISQDTAGVTSEIESVDLDVGEPTPQAAPELAPQEPPLPPAPEPANVRVSAANKLRPPRSFVAGRKARPKYSLVWGLLALLLVLGLAAQIAFYFRVEIVERYPDARIYFAVLCEDLGCTIRLPHRPDMMSIESSDLQADPRREGLIEFNAVLRNRANVAQEYPSLELTLTDEHDQAVLRRVLEPTDYLEARRAADLVGRGIPSGGEASMRLHFDIDELHATGYRLYLFYH